ncbi:rRNA small subunit methyltransferase B [Gulosibacter macacae]|uniref:rRNA small subunit methyltransferase B n=1 Tax=Gulosibacter macacae TaxID=2488791 RepID=A0A3P3VWW4_9MICO|nr:transcription antitermination factor NusB [Gulosibacter macacae]RRJ87275.1 rRNA small subunit methyltransferase B [Gulosibacter macacae]
MSTRNPGRFRDPLPGRDFAARQRGPRAVALDVLIAVDRDDAYANLLLPHRLRDAGLRGLDAALATELTYGTLRLGGYYDEIIRIVAGREIDQIDPVALAALRLGAHQLLGTRVPKHAAVNETVNAARDRGSRGVAGFINANLRAISARTAEEWRTAVAERHERADDRLAALTSHPAWIVRAFRDALADEGREDELEALLDADNVSPLVHLAALPGLADREDVLDAHPTRLVPEPASPIAMRLDGGDPQELREVRAGTVRVQDAGSQLVALALSRVAPIREGERLLDLCAGPGGKSALLAAESLVARAHFEANEVTPSRAKLVRDALRPITPEGHEFEVTEFDGRTVVDSPEKFDRILVDAPCTGLGALRRRPEARWRKQASDLANLTHLQEELLAAALEATAPGGLVAYVTCSPHPAETTAVVKHVLRSHDAEVLDARAICHELAPELDLAERPLAEGTTVQLWPHRHGTDAMFLTLLRKRD